MNAIVKQSGTALVDTDQMASIRTALKNSLYPGASDESVDMVLAYCKAASLDPMTKPVHIVPMSVTVGKDERGYAKKEMRDVVMPGIGLYRINAARTEAYAGCSDPEFGPLKTMQVATEYWTDGPNGKRVKKAGPSVEFAYPEWCRITVTRIVEGVAREFSAREYWIENYATAGNDTDAPNAMWKKRPFGQLAKCTEAQALRKAFPEAVGSQPTAEEMEGRVIEGEVVSTPARVAMPQAKAITHDTSETEADVSDGDQGGAEPTDPTGITGLSEGQRKILLAKARNAGYFNEEELLEKFPSIHGGNLNQVLDDLRTIADERDAG